MAVGALAGISALQTSLQTSHNEADNDHIEGSMCRGFATLFKLKHHIFPQ